MSVKPNLLLSVVNRIHSTVPKALQPTVLSLAFNSQIKYAGTTGIAIQQWSPRETVVNLKNRWRVQNHIQGVHATAMATLAESATGMVFGVVRYIFHVALLEIRCFPLSLLTFFSAFLANNAPECPRYTLAIVEIHDDPLYQNGKR